MRLQLCALVLGLVLLPSSAVFAESKASMPLQASAETIDSVKRLKGTLGTEKEKKSNLVKDTIPWDGGASEGAEPQSNAVRMLQGLGLCLGLFLVGVSIARRINPRLRVKDEQRLSVRSRVPLTNKTQLILAEVDGREIIVAVGQENVAFLETKDGQKQPAEKVRPAVVESGKEFICEEELQYIA